ncbi:MAG: hypothetical protein QW356_05545 [Candidatus Hadarchaeales archaeon]
MKAESRTHGQFFFTLSQLLSGRHGIPGLPIEKISRGDFERSWWKTREELGI